MRYKKAFFSKRNKHHQNRGPYKSRLEANFAKELFRRGLKAEYEATTFAYVRKGHYTPDWKIADDVYVETKGYLSPSNRSNLISFREQHPHVQILLAFQNADNKLNAKSKTTYSEWAEKNGFKWCDLSRGFPNHWFSELVQEKQNPIARKMELFTGKNK